MALCILTLRSQTEAEALMRQIGVDPGGIAIMAPKAVTVLARVSRLPIFAANILKQESLSLGADTAVSRHALTGKTKYTDCLIIGNLAHLAGLCQKLKRQPYGLSRLSDELSSALLNYHRDRLILNSARYKLDLSSRTHIMGILNVTPDSFSGDGLLQQSPARGLRSPVFRDREQGTGDRRQETDIVDYARRLEDEGADILDIGGESSRPGSRPVSLKEELKRVIPVIQAIRKKIKIPISIDTTKAEVARQGLDSGVDIINDISALKGDPRMAEIIRGYNAAVVLMHRKGSSRTMQKNPQYKALMEEIAACLDNAIKTALSKGIGFNSIIVDPGVGFGKGLEHNLKIIKNLGQLKALGPPVLIGLSRKSFIGKLTGEPPQERLSATISANTLAVLNGAKIIRVHDVKAAKSAFLVIDRILRCR